MSASRTPRNEAYEPPCPIRPPDELSALAIQIASVLGQRAAASAPGIQLPRKTTNAELLAAIDKSLHGADQTAGVLTPAELLAEIERLRPAHGQGNKPPP